MEAWAIFRHALRMVFGNFGDALRVTGVPIFAPFALMLFVVFFILPTVTPGAQRQVILLFTFLIVVGSFWSIVGWHRFVLMDERPRFAPKFLAGRILTYIGKAIFVLVLVIPLLMVVLFGVGAALKAGLLNPATSELETPHLLRVFATSQIQGLVVFLPMFALFFRLSPLLPSAALGIRMKISTAWSKTSGHTLTLCGVGALTILGQTVLQIPQFVYLLSLADSVDKAALMGNMGADTSFAASSPVWLDVYEIFSLWLQTMVGASILTTIYGRYVEGRELPR